jgi:hypothetical protein
MNNDSDVFNPIERKLLPNELSDESCGEHESKKINPKEITTRAKRQLTAMEMNLEFTIEKCFYD